MSVSVVKSPAYEIVDFGAHQYDAAEDYPDFVIPLARAVAAGRVDCCLALCGSGVGASVAANKVAGVRAGLIHDIFSAHQGVEDDDITTETVKGSPLGTGLWFGFQCLIIASFVPMWGMFDRLLSNVFCLGGQVIGLSLAIELAKAFLAAGFSGLPRHRRRLSKIAALEQVRTEPDA